MIRNMGVTVRYLKSLAIVFFFVALGHAADSLPDFTAMAATSLGTKQIKKSDLLGHVWIADFFFASCGNICPQMTHQMARLQKRLPKDVWLVSFTVDPKNDSLADLLGYARDNNADPARWYFLRMERPALAKLMYFGFKVLTTYQEPFDNKLILSHNSHFLIVDKKGQLRGSFDGLSEESQKTIPIKVDELLKE